MHPYWWQDLDLNLTNISWTAMWLVGFAFTVWNGWDEWFDWRTQVQLNRRISRITAARWFFRQDVFKAIGFFVVAMAGVASVVRNPALAQNLLFAGGAVLTMNQFANRIERNMVIEYADLDAKADELREQQHRDREELTSHSKGDL